MAKGLESLEGMEYPGRAIILGKSNSNLQTAVYILTGRSTSSQARILVEKERDGIYTQPLDIKKIERPDLLIYPSILFNSEGVAISNGQQTKSINELMDGFYMSSKERPSEILAKALRDWTYEDDKPNYTPRISGCLMGGNAGMAALAILKQGYNCTTTDIFEFGTSRGKGKLIATYTGENKDPLPSFEGVPLAVELPGDSAKEIAENIYNALAPKNPAKDFRVSVAAVILDLIITNNSEVYIKNRHETE